MTPVITFLPFRMSAAILFLTALDFLGLGVPGLPSLDAFVFGSLGIGLAASSAAAINHVVDRRFDRKMARTMNRPIPTGHLTAQQALDSLAAARWVVGRPPGLYSMMDVLGL